VRGEYPAPQNGIPWLGELTLIRVTLRLAVYRLSVRLADKPLETHDQYFFQLNNCFHSPYVISSLTRGWVYCLQLLLVSPAQSFSGLTPAGLVTIFYCLRLETPPTWRARSPYLYPPGTGWSSYTPRHWVPFSSPPTTRRTTWRYSTPPPHGRNPDRKSESSIYGKFGVGLKTVPLKKTKYSETQRIMLSRTKKATLKTK
jgi:hypothetical protein